MIEFVSLLLGLVSGPQVVEVRTAQPVARVEILLDGELAAQAESPPWRFAVDLGDELAPHELAAVARNGAGGELGRAVQRVNLPRGSAEARWVMENGPDGTPAFASLVWEHMWGAVPSTVDVRFDGVRLDEVDPRRFALPPYEPSEVHLLTAELSFPQGGRARAEAVFGGRYGERVESELTALPVVSEGRGPPGRSQVTGRFRSRDRQLRVVAVDHGGPDVVVVRDATAQRVLARRISQVERSQARLFHRAPRDLLPLGDGARVRFVWPSLPAVADELGRRVEPGQFAAPLRFEFEAERRGLPWLLSHTSPPPVPQRVADAVALAGVLAAGGNRPRAVLLVVDPATVDRSRYAPAQVRRFLRRLRVPLLVWSVTGEPVPAWGAATPVTQWAGIRTAARALRRTLDRQAVVWLEGSHLPQQVELTPADGALDWAGAPRAP